MNMDVRMRECIVCMKEKLKKNYNKKSGSNQQHATKPSILHIKNSLI
jgi:hypothetical protein